MFFTQKPTIFRRSIFFCVCPLLWGSTGVMRLWGYAITYLLFSTEEENDLVARWWLCWLLERFSKEKRQYNHRLDSPLSSPQRNVSWEKSSRKKIFFPRSPLRSFFLGCVIIIFILRFPKPQNITDRNGLAKKGFRGEADRNILEVIASGRSKFFQFICNSVEDFFKVIYFFVNFIEKTFWRKKKLKCILHLKLHRRQLLQSKMQVLVLKIQEIHQPTVDRPQPIRAANLL